MVPTGHVGTSTGMAALRQEARMSLFAPLTDADALRRAQLARLVYNVRTCWGGETEQSVKPRFVELSMLTADRQVRV